MAVHATQVSLKNCAPFTKCITKIDGKAIGDAKNLDLVMLVYNLLKCSSNYSDTTGSVWFYSHDEATNFNADTGNTNAFKSFEYKSFEYKAKLLGNTVAQPASNQANGILKNAAIAVLLK